jgi:hypothetical protein
MAESLRGLVSGRPSLVGQFGLEVGNAFVQEPIVVPGTDESFLQPTVLLTQAFRVTHPGFAGDSTSWEGWSHVEEIGELSEGAAGTTKAPFGADPGANHTAQGSNWQVCSLENTSGRRLLNSVAGLGDGVLRFE